VGVGIDCSKLTEVRSMTTQQSVALPRVCTTHCQTGEFYCQMAFKDSIFPNRVQVHSSRETECKVSKSAVKAATESSFSYRDGAKVRK